MASSIYEIVLLLGTTVGIIMSLFKLSNYIKPQIKYYFGISSLENKFDSLELLCYKYIILANIDKYLENPSNLLLKEIHEDYDKYKKLGGNSYVDEKIKELE